MFHLADPGYVSLQYRDKRNLDARIALHQGFSTAPRDFHLWVFDHFDLQHSADILELGCGTGALWQKNRERIPASWRLTFSDFSFGMLQTMQSLSIPTNSLCIQLDAQEIPLRDGTFDAVVADHMLYHVPNLSRALSEVRRVLRVGGKLYAATNGDAHMRECFALIADLTNIETPRLPLSFTLENGAAQLEKDFASVERFDFEDGLNVTEVEPIVRYVQSVWVGKEWIGAGCEINLRRAISERIARDGVFRITKSTGLFVAAKA